MGVNSAQNNSNLQSDQNEHSLRVGLKFSKRERTFDIQSFSNRGIQGLRLCEPKWTKDIRRQQDLNLRSETETDF